MPRLVTVVALVALLPLAPPACQGESARFAKGMRAYSANDFDAARVEWQPLAEAGHAASQHNLGIMYYRGQGVEQNYPEAVRWFRRAAEQGAEGAPLSLAVMLARGYGTEPDPVEAYTWVQIALGQGDAEAETWRASLVKRMTAEQIQQAEAAAAAWRPASR